MSLNKAQKIKLRSLLKRIIKFIYKELPKEDQQLFIASLKKYYQGDKRALDNFYERSGYFLKIKEEAEEELSEKLDKSIVHQLIKNLQNFKDDTFPCLNYLRNYKDFATRQQYNQLTEIFAGFEENSLVDDGDERGVLITAAALAAFLEEDEASCVPDDIAEAFVEISTSLDPSKDYVDKDLDSHALSEINRLLAQWSGPELMREIYNQYQILIKNSLFIREVKLEVAKTFSEVTYIGEVNHEGVKLTDIEVEWEYDQKSDSVFGSSNISEDEIYYGLLTSRELKEDSLSTEEQEEIMEEAEGLLYDDFQDSAIDMAEKEVWEEEGTSFYNAAQEALISTLRKKIEIKGLRDEDIRFFVEQSIRSSNKVPYDQSRYTKCIIDMVSQGYQEAFVRDFQDFITHHQEEIAKLVYHDLANSPLFLAIKIRYEEAQRSADGLVEQQKMLMAVSKVLEADIRDKTKRIYIDFEKDFRYQSVLDLDTGKSTKKTFDPGAFHSSPEIKPHMDAVEHYHKIYSADGVPNKLVYPSKHIKKQAEIDTQPLLSGIRLQGKAIRAVLTEEVKKLAAEKHLKKKEAFAVIVNKAGQLLAKLDSLTENIKGLESFKEAAREEEEEARRRARSKVFSASFSLKMYFGFFGKIDKTEELNISPLQEALAILREGDIECKELNEAVELSKEDLSNPETLRKLGSKIKEVESRLERNTILDIPQRIKDLKEKVESLDATETHTIQDTMIACEDFLSEDFQEEIAKLVYNDLISNLLQEALAILREGDIECKELNEAVELSKGDLSSPEILQKLSDKVNEVEALLRRNPILGISEQISALKERVGALMSSDAHTTQDAMIAYKPLLAKVKKDDVFKVFVEIQKLQSNLARNLKLEVSMRNDTANLIFPVFVFCISSPDRSKREFIAVPFELEGLPFLISSDPEDGIFIGDVKRKVGDEFSRVSSDRKSLYAETQAAKIRSAAREDNSFYSISGATQSSDQKAKDLLKEGADYASDRGKFNVITGHSERVLTRALRDPEIVAQLVTGLRKAVKDKFASVEGPIKVYSVTMLMYSDNTICKHCTRAVISTMHDWTIGPDGEEGFLRVLATELNKRVVADPLPRFLAYTPDDCDKRDHQRVGLRGNTIVIADRLYIHDDHAKDTERHPTTRIAKATSVDIKKYARRNCFIEVADTPMEGVDPEHLPSNALVSGSTLATLGAVEKKSQALKPDGKRKRDAMDTAMRTVSSGLVNGRTSSNKEPPPMPSSVKKQRTGGIERTGFAAREESKSREKSMSH